MNWKIESWNTEYALPEVSFEEPLEDRQVNLDLEGVWQAVEPERVPPARWPELALVDGRQRLDAVLADPQGNRVILATVSAGAALRDSQGMRFAGEPWVRRVLLYPQGQEEPSAIRVEGLVYQPQAVQAEDLQSLRSRITEVMRALEGELARTLYREGRVVVVDGPIHPGVGGGEGVVMGYTKSNPGVYLPPGAADLPGQLLPYQRTPIFKLPAFRMGRPVEVLSWYVKLPLNPQTPFHAGAGVMRVETPMTDLERARETADFSVSLLCALASSPARDPRAPQNLVAVGALEGLLGRYMGSGGVIRRKIVGTLLG